MTPGQRTVRLLAGWTVYGLALGLAKGDSGGWRLAAGNLSAPYLLPAVAAGWTAAAPRAAAALGVAATVATLLGFYLWQGPAYGIVTRATLLDHVGPVFVLGAVLGVLLGPLGRILAGTRPVTRLVVCALPFVVEPAAQLLPGRLGDFRGDPSSLRAHPGVFAAEAAVGLLLGLAAARRRRRATASPRGSDSGTWSRLSESNR